MTGHSTREITCKRCSLPFTRAHAAERFCQHCKESAAKETRRRAVRAWRDRNADNLSYREKRRARSKSYAARNPERVAAQQKEYAERKASEKAEKSRLWREMNPEKYRAAILKRQTERRAETNARQVVWSKEKRLRDPGYALNCRMSSAIRSALRRGKSGRPWLELVDFTLSDLMSHLERQFTKGMSWHNRGEWHIDHVLPLSSFTYETPDDPDFQKAWGLTNLRPLWAADNLSKGAKRLLLV